MHTERVTEQYEQMKLLKLTLAASHVTVQVDFAENYFCNYADEVQSASYSKEQATMHPAVINFNEVNQTEDWTPTILLVCCAIQHDFAPYCVPFYSSSMHALCMCV